MVYRFKVTYEEHENVVRYIDIKATQSFSDFHLAIQQAIGFDNSKPATFYLSDDYWRKEKEIITITNIQNPNKKIRKKKKSTRKKTKSTPKYSEQPKKQISLAECIDNPHQKFVYIFDPDKEWTFLIELVKILPEDSSVKYPQCVKSVGKAPKQYKEVNLPSPSEESEYTTEEREEMFSDIQESFIDIENEEETSFEDEDDKKEPDSED
jgi:hypothetical protein